MSPKTRKYVGIAIILIGIAIVGIKTVDLLIHKESGYAILGAGILNIIGGILIIGSSQKKDNGMD